MTSIEQQQDEAVFAKAKTDAHQEYERNCNRLRKIGNQTGLAELKQNRVSFQSQIVRSQLTAHFTAQAQLAYDNRRKQLLNRKRFLKTDLQALQAVEQELNSLIKADFVKAFVNEKMSNYMNNFETASAKKKGRKRAGT